MNKKRPQRPLRPPPQPPKSPDASYETTLLKQWGPKRFKSLIESSRQTLKGLLENPAPKRPQPFSTTPGGLALDEWQFQCLQALKAGQHLIVDAPTSAGKTRVIEAWLEECMPKRQKLIYTSPVKSLSNDKYADFCKMYDRSRVGINTGDFKENLTAPIVLATLETYRNSLLGLEPALDPRVVVYDEYHYLQDDSRGSAWEESLILTPKNSQLILLSASVPNCEEFAKWLEDLTGQACAVVRVHERPVPLLHVVAFQGELLLADQLVLSTKDKKAIFEARKKQTKFQQKPSAQNLVPLVKGALSLGLDPIVIYAGRRGDVEALAMGLFSLLNVHPEPGYVERLKGFTATLPGWEYVPTRLQKMILRQGIAYHHSGLMAPARVAIESLLKEGYLRVCTGTMGISLGVNFAVRSALIADTSRPGEGGESTYSNTEIMQMLGRAGRRGSDAYGFSLWPSIERFLLQKPKERESCKSALKFDPTTILGLLGHGRDGASLSSFYKSSFFMRHRNPMEVLVPHHDLLFGILYRESHIDDVPCRDIHQTYRAFHQGLTKICHTCPARKPCHRLCAEAEKSTLTKILSHLDRIQAIEHEQPTRFGDVARCFPQAGGLVIASFLTKHNGDDPKRRPQLWGLMGMFCSAHFKDIPRPYLPKFTDSLEWPRLQKDIDRLLPEFLFPELYDTLTPRPGRFGHSGDHAESRVVFREFNPGAGSLVTQWLNEKTPWEDLVYDHGSKAFSEGDCMAVLFRFASFVQSCARLGDVFPELAQDARRVLQTVLRDPLDARHRMLV